jgi:hypothetical protein
MLGCCMPMLLQHAAMPHTALSWLPAASQQPLT